MAKLLAKPAWSIQSLLTSKASKEELSALTTDKLQRLLRLAALPKPKNDSEVQEKLATLSSQLGFVKDIQGVDTEGVQPLQVLRDETKAAYQEMSLATENVKDALEREKLIGKHHKRLRTGNRNSAGKSIKSWDILDHAQRRAGKYFVVVSEKIE